LVIKTSSCPIFKTKLLEQREHISLPHCTAIDTSQRIVKMESWFTFNPWKAISREQTVSPTNLFLFHHFTWKSFV